MRHVCDDFMEKHTHRHGEMGALRLYPEDYGPGKQGCALFGSYGFTPEHHHPRFKCSPSPQYLSYANLITIKCCFLWLLIRSLYVFYVPKFAIEEEITKLFACKISNALFKIFSLLKHIWPYIIICEYLLSNSVKN